MTIEAIATDIHKKGGKRSPALIAIEGFGGSGKSTIAQRLASILDDAYVVGIDDFIVKGKLTEHTWDGGAFDRRRLEEQVLGPISRGEPARYQKLIWDTNKLSEPIEIPKTEFLIVEGITAYHPDIEQYYDFKIWVDTPLEVAKQRGHDRDGANENADFWDLWSANDTAYMDQYHPEQRADYTISNL